MLTSCMSLNTSYNCTSSSKKPFVPDCVTTCPVAGTPQRTWNEDEKFCPCDASRLPTSRLGDVPGPDGIYVSSQGCKSLPRTHTRFCAFEGSQPLMLLNCRRTSLIPAVYAERLYVPV